ncbi:Plasma membrane ATPase [Elsinoe australis]|uniref:Plasma membrane ATPase n=1 Tax=Elsinoe australis TaxID=40998 RepID=A0A2P7ZD95_9PEZI|nr:Plasma membrane ATPase [Elsinoe australis]
MNKDSHTFVFVHAQNLQDLHSNKYDKHVRQAVMNNYLRKAMQDPSTTDRRITRQRRTDVRQRRKGATANYESPPDDHQSVGVENDVKLNTLTPKSDESLAFVPANESPILDHSPAHEAHTTTHSGSGTPASNDGASQRRCSSVFFKEVSDPGVEIERYFESFNHIKEQVIPTAIDVEWLRGNCVRYFRTQGMMQQWIPLQLLSPLAYLSRLCITAPYTDIMTSQGFEDPAYPNSDPRLTLEIFDIVPRLINESMNDMAERCSDSCFVAVIQLFYGQLFSPYAGLVASHREGLVQMIQQRGGIDCLGGDGILAMNVCLVNMEADVILNQPTDASHLQWSRSYITKHEAVGEPCPEGPLHCVSPWMLSIASNSLCPLETFRAISLARQLSELVSGMYMSTASNSGPDSAYREIERERKQQDVSDLVLQIRQLPPAHTSSQSEPRVWIYESIRRAALLFAQAVSMRKPLHLACSDSLHRATVSAEDIYIAVKESPIVDVWGSMAGVLYWVLLIAAAAACNTQPERLDHRNEVDHEMTDVSHDQPRDAGTNPVHRVQHQTVSAQAPRHTFDDLECDRRRLSITALDTFQDSSLRWL